MSDNQGDLSGRVAIVTGGTRGIGRACAFFLARRGASVVVSSRKEGAVHDTVEAMRAENLRAAGKPAHAGSPEDMQHLGAFALETFKRVDIVVNNAGTNPIFGGVDLVTPEAFHKIFSVNLLGPIELAKCVLPALKVRGGSIVNIASIGGTSPEDGLGVYSASKAALISITKSMAREWGAFNIRANAVCPGFIQTDLSRVMWDDEAMVDSLVSATPLRRLGQPEDVAHVVHYLASDASAFCTGAVFTVDGGLRA
jgi:NAD(P)-dependent dehydrogenase (short-subunit alcohol dehydrogenase family)